jgi:hypothetical protein
MIKPCTVVCLRPGVRVTEEGVDICIAFAHWRVSIPLRVLHDDCALANLLAGHPVHPRDIGVSHTGIIQLLEAQGCFLPTMPQLLTAKGLLALFQPIRSQLFAQYYAHPVWKRLRSGKATRAELHAWMLHNYHISRCAGPIVARMATHTSEVADKKFFCADVLEEYWHYDAFFRVEECTVGHSHDALQRYVPLPASTAFEDYALQTAEHLPLGHLLINYFQESSIAFAAASNAFYDCVEREYGIAGAFVGWRQHIALDLKHAHVTGLSERFSDTWVVGAQEARNTLRAVHIAHFFLMSALDEIAAHAQVEDALTMRQPENVITRSPVGPSGMPPEQATYLLRAVKRAVFCALAHAREHAPILALGKIAAHFAQVDITCTDPEGCPWPWVGACATFVIERAVEPTVCLVLLHEVLAVLQKSSCSIVRSTVEKLCVNPPKGSTARVALETAKLRELLTRAVTSVPLEELLLAQV